MVLTIRCLPDIFESSSRKGSGASRTSRQSRQSRALSSRNKGSDTSLPPMAKIDTANAINAKDRPHALARFHSMERNSSPPPGVFLYFEFEVTDTGPGIPDHLHHKIFEPFVQGDLGLTKKYGGTGLGLSICSQLAGLMRGTMGMTSTVGIGSTFNMKIPLRHLRTRVDSSASSGVDVPVDSGGLRRSASLDESERTPARHSRGLLSDEKNEEKTPNNAAHPSTPSLAPESQPRLVGLSQPFFAASQPMDSPGSQPAAMEKLAAEATRSGKIRVLVAEGMFPCI